MNQVQLYRGAATMVPAGTTDVSALAQATGLDWQPVALPLAMRGRREIRDVPNRKALVRSDNGDFLSIVSNDFKVHTNAEILTTMMNVVNAGNLTVKAGGFLPGSNRVFLQADSAVSTDISTRKVGDITKLTFFVTGGHEPGTPFLMQAQALRLVCLNGACVSNDLATVRISHRQKFTVEMIRQIAGVVAGAADAFQTYCEAMRRFGTIAVRPAVETATLLQIAAPEVLQNILNIPATLDSKAVMVEVLRRESEASLPHWLYLDAVKSGSRVFTTLHQVAETQPGRQFSKGSLANAYHAVTHWSSHVRGRDAMAAVERDLGSEGMKLKTRALNVCNTVAELVA